MDTEKWIESLKPEYLKRKLISYAFYIAIYESLTDNIIEEVRSFYNVEFLDKEGQVSPKYRADVLSKNRSQLYASILWLQEQEALDVNDLLIFEELKKYRNRLSHKMMDLLFDETLEDYPNKLASLIKLRIKIDKWWIMNVDIPTNPDFDGTTETKDEDIYSSAELFFKMLFDIIYGDEETSSFHYRELIKQNSSKQ